ncbi:MAG TPA: hypothetical protein VGN26_06165 [Armatimonadota bacterium]|jgi:hypothetical protein
MGYALLSVFFLLGGASCLWAVRRSRALRGIPQEVCFQCGGLLLPQPSVETRREVVKRPDGRPGQIAISYGFDSYYECRRCRSRYRIDAPNPSLRRLVALPRREPEIELHREALPLDGWSAASEGRASP